MNKFLCTVLMMMAFLAPVARADQGNEGHGGDPYAAEFVARGYAICAKVKDSGSGLLTPAEIERFEAALRTTQIMLVTEEIQDPVAGAVMSVVIDDPAHPGQKIIRLNKASWMQVLNDKINIERYIFHEYLRAIGVEDSHYEVSNKLDQPPPYVNTIDYTIIESLDGQLVPATRGYAANRNPDQYDVSCRSSITHEDEVNAKTRASETYLDAFLSVPERRRDELEAEWTSRLPAGAIWKVTTHTSDNSRAVIMSDAEGFYNPWVYVSYVWTGSPQAGKWKKFFMPTGYEPPVLYANKIALLSSQSMSCPAELAFQKSGRLTTTVYINDNVIRLKKLENQAVSGATVRFNAYPSSTPGQFVAAINSAYESYRQACRTWKAGMQQRLGERFVFADCGLPTQARMSAGVGTYEMGVSLPASNSIVRPVHFESVGTVYYKE